jgi:hypothetical protein
MMAATVGTPFQAAVELVVLTTASDAGSATARRTENARNRRREGAGRVEVEGASFIGVVLKEW